MRTIVVAALLVACGTGGANPAPTPAAKTAPPPGPAPAPHMVSPIPQPPARGDEPRVALAELGWLRGAWGNKDSDVRWFEVATALYGVELSAAGYRITIIDDSDERGKPAPLTAVVIENGAPSKVMALYRARVADARARSLDFTDGERTLSIALSVEGLTWQRGDVQLAWIRRTHGFDAAAPDLVAADRAFATDSAKRGADAWIDRLATGGVYLQDQPLRDPRAIRAAVAETLAGGLVWVPSESGAVGETGFTAGGWTYGKNVATGSYLTLWRRDGGTWKVLFDGGRPANR